MWLEALLPGEADLTFAFTGTVNALGITHQDTLKVTTWEIAKPSGETIGENNWALWDENQLGLTFNCQILPESLDTEIYWTLDPNDFPEPQFTKITWDQWDKKNDRPHVGVGTNPKLKVTYENPQSKYADFMPPDNRWFGQKTLTVQVGDVTVTRPVWFFFNPYATRTNRQGGKQEHAWFHYYKEGRVVLALANLDFEFDIAMAKPAAHSWDAIWGDRYYVGPLALSAAMKPVFDVTAIGDSYSEVHYPDDEKKPLHHLSKYCDHEFWHAVLRGETRWPFGLGHADSDGDNLSNVREAELGTNPNLKDTVGISRFQGDSNYSGYASYADEELFCRVKQGFAPKGQESKDWSIWGVQSPIQGN